MTIPQPKQMTPSYHTGIADCVDWRPIHRSIYRSRRSIG